MGKYCMSTLSSQKILIKPLQRERNIYPTFIPRKPHLHNFCISIITFTQPWYLEIYIYLSLVSRKQYMPNLYSLSRKQQFL